MDFICKVTNNYRFCDFFFQKLRINMKTVWNFAHLFVLEFILAFSGVALLIRYYNHK